MTNSAASNDHRALSAGTVPWWHWHRRLYDWVIGWSHTAHAQAALFILAFSESSFFPVPPDVLLAAMSLGAPKKWLRFALLCSIASLIGGAFGYLIGMFLWQLIGPWVFAHLAFLGLTEPNFAKFQSWYDKYDFWIVFTCGFTPLPYKVCTISAGVASINFLGFCIASAVSRSARFFIVAGLLGWKGEKIKPVLEKYFNLLSFAFVILLIAGFLALKWLK
jgi:membrane protein YqaA with SNARE-associated domain